MEDNEQGTEIPAQRFDICDKRGDAKVARNAKCPCGSGRKFKHCCLRD